MRRVLVPSLTLMLCLSACGGGATSPATTSRPPSTAPTTAAGTTTIATTTSTPPTTIASTSAPPLTTFTFPDLLRKDGIASVDFGTSEAEAMAALTPLLGPADTVEKLDSSDLYISVEQVVLMTWEDFGVRLAFTDWNGDWENPAPVPLHISDWEVIGPGLKTTAGIGWGSTTAELLTAYPETVAGINEWAASFIAGDEPNNRIMGGFQWEFADLDAALQDALAERGFPTDGTTGSGLGQALLDFVDANDLVETWTVLSALGLPPGTVLVGWMHAGTGPLCC